MGVKLGDEFSEIPNPRGKISPMTKISSSEKKKKKKDVPKVYADALNSDVSDSPALIYYN
jgi:hypothetical protein